ncbi:hypothetical protein [uncultured Roseovarius sp.]|uniref:hypothetical protein n=1 Tax=uncultured Roseovarius sp. TaxID=293344 RepID=UPI0026030C12|nr:hypothetical protein [uncultured Roseovarius sp.]
MKAILVAVAALAFAVSPFFVPFDGFDPNLYPVAQDNPPVQPAGYAFSIWGLIYLWLLVHGGFGLLRRDTDAVWDRPRWPLFISLAVGASWLSVAQVSPVMATILIWVMLVTALAALFRSKGPDRWLLQAPLSIYAGWLTAASFVSLGLLGAGYGIGVEEVGWAWIALGAALVFAAGIQMALGQAPEYGLTVVWALVAVIVANWGENTGIALLAAAGAIGMALLAFKNRTA